MNLKNKVLQVAVTEFKLDKETGMFTCYGNVKGNIDHARDRTLDGAYQSSIDEHKLAGTMPKMFWMHKSFDLPVGVWLEMKEDSRGLWMKGQLLPTTMGKDIEILAKANALDSFSIGYQVIEEKWNAENQCNDLIKLRIKEISWVTYACNDQSLLQDIKTSVHDGNLPSKAELREILKSTGWLSKREVERITAVYNPETKSDEIDLKELGDILANSVLFK